MVKFGERVRSARLRKGLTIDEVAKATRIRSHFISALEAGNYKKLPSAYIQGFARNYVEFLSLPSRELMALFRREFDEREYVSVLPESFTNRQEWRLHRFKLSQAISFTVLVLLLLSGYVLWQYLGAFFDPGLNVLTPKENAVLTTQSITVTGTTDPNNTVTIDNDPAFVDSSGHFKKLVTIFAGKKTVSIKAINHFGKKQIVERHVTVQPQ